MSKTASMSGLKAVESIAMSASDQKKATEALVSAIQAANEDALARRAANAALLKIKVNPADVALLASEFEVENAVAEKWLREHDNDCKAVIKGVVAGTIALGKTSA